MAESDQPEMSSCPDPGALLEFGRGVLPPAERERVRAHVAGCLACAATLRDRGLPSGYYFTVTRLDPTNEGAISDTRAHPGGNGTPPSAADDFSLSTDAPGEADLPGSLGRYTLLSRIGRGGMGTVYLGLDVELRREVAVKVPHGGRLTGPRQVDSFLAEAQALARLDHSGIVPVYDFGRTKAGRCYLVSKYIHGCSLYHRMAAGRIPRSEAARIIAEVAEALHHAHLRGLVHRDIKPGNILIDTEGRPVVVDFGVAMREEDFGRTPGWAGTPSYMSPEQARGEGHLVDARTDVYSLGVVLYELLTGARPFVHDDRDTLLELVAAGEFPPPRQVDANVPRELERVCLKAMAGRAGDRYRSARELADDLHCWLAGEDSVPPAGAGPPHAQGGSAGPGTYPVYAVAPKGPRPYGAEDADVFLSLLPGPRGRDGLPESVAFWKARLEARDPDQTFRVGVCYGPSGCGKSSLFRAGLIPRLAPDVAAVYVECSGERTEGRLLRALRRHASGLPPKIGLAEAVAAVRRDPALAGSRKTVIVLDQFEQWLHARSADGSSELIQAVRQCDGANVQCVLLARDDFWLSVTRFLREVESPASEGQNSLAVELFTPRHARQVLTAFGRAYGALDADKPGPAAQRFLDQAVSGLTQAGWVVPVRLSLFAECFRSRPWTPAALREAGGPEGVGMLFLEDAFNGPGAPPERRLHLEAARRVLEALLPEGGGGIRGRPQPRERLEQASGYKDRPREFEELLRILDAQLRLVTPVDPEGAAEPAGTAHGHYQLTHDYLVGAVSGWLTRKRRETLRGRIELRLAERAAVWASRPESRNLPSLPEWLGGALLGTRPSWGDGQRRMMHAARRHHLARLGLAAAAVVAAALGAWALWAHNARQRDEALARAAVERVLDAETADVPRAVESLDRHRRYAVPILTEVAGNPARPAKARLHAEMALLRYDPARAEAVARAGLTAAPEQVAAIAVCLARHAPPATGPLWDALGEPSRPAGERLRAACLLARLEPHDARWANAGAGAARALTSENSVHATRFADALRPARTWLTPALEAQLADTSVPEASRDIAASVLADYAADDPAGLARVARVASGRSLPSLIAALRPHGSKAVAELIREVDREAPRRPAESPVPWPSADAGLRSAVEGAEGLLGERSAVCQALPPAQFAELAAGLSRCGYRPCSLRPYASPDGVRLTVGWVRDGRRWEAVLGVPADDIRSRDAACRERGLVPADVASRPPDRPGGQESFAALWADLNAEVADAALYVAVPDPKHKDYWQGLNERGFVPRTNLVTYGAGGEALRTSVRWRLRRTATEYRDCWESDASDCDRCGLGWYQADVRLVPSPSGSAPRYAGAWWNGSGRECRACRGLSLSEHADWGRRAAAEGFRPVSVAVAWNGETGRTEAASVWDRSLPTEADRDALARGRSASAAALLHLGQPEYAWRMLRDTPDPRAQTALIRALFDSGTDPGTLVDRLGNEDDAGARRALLLTLAEYPGTALGGPGGPAGRRAAALWRNDPDPGVHSAAELLLRRFDATPPDGDKEVKPSPDRRWFRNAFGQTFAVVRGPAEFRMGSPGDEPEHRAYQEEQHPVRIERSYAIGTTEVTVRDFQRFRPDFDVALDYTPTPDCPITRVTWYDAAAYCRWLSEQERLPESEMCYPPIAEIKKGMTLRDDMFKRKGYRLPTEAEWEYAARAGTISARHYGHSEATLPAYAWLGPASNFRAAPVGRLRPNPWGLFDTLGNAMEWCHDRFEIYTFQPDVVRLDAPCESENTDERYLINEKESRIRRGGSFLHQPSDARSAQRDPGLPSGRHPFLGFRIVRTID